MITVLGLVSDRLLHRSDSFRVLDTSRVYRTTSKNVRSLQNDTLTDTTRLHYTAGKVDDIGSNMSSLR